jgi:endonuclease/exonuclease/phosphatase family metal-dependent hydrolase
MRTTLGALAAVLTLALLGIQPAQAATTPPQVGLVSITAGSITGSTATMTIDWPATSHARKYQVFMSRSYGMSSARTFTTTGSSKKVTGLARGANYFFQVRAINGSKIGKKSQRVGHTAIRRQGPGNGATYRVMTYNVCSSKCSDWTGREKPAMARIAAYKPDVVALQEAESKIVNPPSGYTEATFKSAKKLWFKTSRFRLAEACAAPVDGAAPVCGNRASYITMRSGKYAVWAELVDQATGKSTIFVSVHTTSGKSDSAAVQRRDEVTKLVAEIRKINPGGRLPVVYAGDFNSHKNRSNDYLAGVLHGEGFYDAYDLAMALRRQHQNSYNDYKTRPVISYKWGDHVDHVWINPSAGKVLKWDNGALLVDGRLVTPIPSDHSPVVVDLRLN